jgi:hypothetical protein
MPRLSVPKLNLKGDGNMHLAVPEKERGYHHWKDNPYFKYLKIN